MTRAQEKPDSDLFIFFSSIKANELSTAPKDMYGIPILPLFAELDARQPIQVSDSENSSDTFDEASYRSWPTITNMDHFHDLIKPLHHKNEGETHAREPFIVDRSLNSSSETAVISLYHSPPQLQHRKRERLEEFTSAFLGISAFDAADIWIPSSPEKSDSLYHQFSVSATEKDKSMTFFKKESQSSIVKKWSGTIGRAYTLGKPVWTTKKVRIKFLIGNSILYMDDCFLVFFFNQMIKKFHIFPLKPND